MASSKKTAAYRLTPAEQRNPALVIEELFDFADLQDIRELLWLWLKTTVSGSSYHKTLNGSERMAIIDLYEKISKLVEAASVMQNAEG